MRVALLHRMLLLFLTSCTFHMPTASSMNGTSKRNLQEIQILRVQYQLQKTSLVPALQTVLVCFGVIILVASILCNSLIIHTVRTYPRMHTTTNYFIVNMAAGDILATIAGSTHSLKYVFVGHRWIPGLIGKITCKLQFWGLLTGTFCSVFSLVALTVDRFLAVRHPLRYKSCSKWPRVAVPLVWIIAVLLPMAVTWYNFTIVAIHPSIANETYCLHDGTKEGNIWTLTAIIVGFVAPLVIMKMCYSCMACILWKRKVPGEQQNQQNRAHKTAKKVTSMVTCIIVVFELCWSPFFIVSFLTIAYPHIGNAIHVSGLLSSFFLVQLNGPFNVIMYAVFNENFRKGFKQSLRCFAKIKVDREKLSQPVLKGTHLNSKTSA